MLDIELLPMPAATCCGAGDIAEAKPNLYLTLNVRILSQAEEMGVDVLTICNVCTLNLRRANKMVKEDAAPAGAGQRGAGEGRGAPLRGHQGGHPPPLVPRHRGGAGAAREAGPARPQRPAGGAVLRLPAAAAVVGDGLRGPRPAAVARAADHSPSAARSPTTRPSPSAAASRSSSPAAGGAEGVAPRAVAVAATPAPTAWSRPARSATSPWTPTSARPRRRTRPSTTCRCCTCRSSSAWPSASTLETMDFKRHLVPVDRVLEAVGVA